jgi:[acyl-carrier-protein] S-malonyltransferase
MSLALLCPGQGGQHAAMFARVQGRAAAVPVLQQLDRVLGSSAAALAANDARFDNRNAQPLVCAASLAHWQALRAQLPAPAMVLGYSVGELAAHAVAGSVGLEDCIALASARAQLMDAASPPDSGLIAVVGLVRARIDALCGQHGAAVAIANGADHFVLGGPRAALDSLGAQAATAGARCTPLPVRVPAHTPWLQSAAHGFAQTLAAAALQAPRTLVLAGIDGSAVRSPDAVIATLSAQLAQTVEWATVMDQAVERGANMFLELGPGSALSRMVRQAHPDCEARSVDEFQTLEGVVEWVVSAQSRLA